MIYLLEDDGGIRSFVIYALNSCGLDAAGFEAPSELYRALDNELPELLLLDIMLPEEDGLTVLRKLRSAEKTAKLPIILLSAKGTEFDKVTGLDSGADDYIAKPFGTMELISRVKALLRRTSGERQKENVITIGEMTIYPSRHEVYADGAAVNLTNKEYELLLILAKNRNMVFSRDVLLKEVWGYGFKGESRTVDVHIRTLRSKLGSCGDIIRTVRGAGYKAGENDLD